jgi:hypothetical protein
MEDKVLSFKGATLAGIKINKTDGSYKIVFDIVEKDSIPFTEIILWKDKSLNIDVSLDKGAEFDAKEEV